MDQVYEAYHSSIFFPTIPPLIQLVTIHHTYVTQLTTNVQYTTAQVTPRVQND
jgi:hypothetical protein